MDQEDLVIADLDGTAQGHIVFSVPDEDGKNMEMLRLEAGGDIYVKGNLTVNDLEVVLAFREWLAKSKY